MPDPANGASAQIFRTDKGIRMPFHILDDLFYAFFVLYENLLVILFLERTTVQQQAVFVSHRVIDKPDPASHRLDDHSRKLNFIQFFPGSDMIAGQRRLFFHHRLIGQFHRIIQIKHGKGSSVAGRNLAGLQRLQTHLKAGVTVFLSSARNTVEMVETQNHGIDSLRLAVILADLLALGDRQRLKPSGRRRLRLCNIVMVGTAEHFMGGKIDEPSLTCHGIGRKYVHQRRSIAHRLLSLPVPVKVRIISAHEHDHIRLHALENVLDALIFIWIIIPLKYMLIRKLSVSAARQQEDPVFSFIQFVDHCIDHPAASTNQ